MKKLDPHPAISKNRLLGLLRLMRGNRLAYGAAVLATGVAALAQTGTYLLIRMFVDTVLPRGSSGPLPAAAAGFVGLAALQGTFSFLGGRLAARTAEWTTRALRDRFYDQVQRLPFAYLDKAPTGDLVERATSDMDAVRKFYSEQAIGFGRVVLVFGVNFAALLALSPRLALVSVLVIPLVLAVSIVFFRVISKRYEKYQEQEAALSTMLQENLTGVRVVKAFARQEVPPRAAAPGDERRVLAGHRRAVRPADAGGIRVRRGAGGARRAHGGHLHGVRRHDPAAGLAHPLPREADRGHLERAGLLRAAGGDPPRAAGAPRRGDRPGPGRP
jgi:ABC-type multidrug transport system fused ATPase/permease subunit